MDVTPLTELLGAPAPSTTVIIDVSSTDAVTTHETEVRWRDQRRALADAGAPEADLAAIDEVVLEPTGVGGPTSRCVAARDGRVVLQQLMHQATADGVGEAGTGPLVDVVPVLRYRQRHPRVVVVRADREGADVEVVTAAGGPPLDQATTGSTGGDLHLVNKGDDAESKAQHASENTWRGNADQAASAAGRLARSSGATAVVVAGEAHARTLVVEALELPVTVAVSEVDGDARAPGASQEALQTAVARGLDEQAARAEDDAVQRWRAVHDDPETATRSTDDLGSTVVAVRQGQVEELLLVPAALRPRTLLVGPAGTDVTAPGTEPFWDGEVHEVPADLALVRAAAHTGADVQLVELESAALPDGVGARLRWARDAAPGEGPGAT